jgi:hypothetical protein
MVVEAVQNYVNLMNGLSKMTRERALSVARALLSQVGLEDVANEAGERVSKLADEIMLASRANRELVEKLVSTEVDKAAARWGFVRADEVDALREELAELRLALVRATVAAGSESSTESRPPTARRARKAPTRKAAPLRPTGPRQETPQGPPLGGAPDGPTPDPVDQPFPPDPFAPDPAEPDAVPVGSDSLSEPLDTDGSPLIATPAEQGRATPVPEESSVPVTSPAKKTATRKSAVKKSAQPGTGAAPAKKSPAKRSPAKRSPAKKAAIAIEPVSEPIALPAGDGTP